MSNNNEYLLLTKIESFDDIMTIKLKYFPRHERYCISKDIRNSINKSIHLIIELNKRYFKKTSLTELDVEIGYLQYLVRKSYKLKYINIETYKTLSSILTEEGRMIGAWIKNIYTEEKKKKPL